MSVSARRVLVVDDEAASRRATRALLEVAGFEVASAEHGAGALAALAEAPVDVVLSDLRSPAIDGVEVLRQIRRRWPELPVVLTTAFTLSTCRGEAEAEGACMLLTRRSRLSVALAALLRAIARPIVLVVDECELDVIEVTTYLESQGLRAAATADAEVALAGASTGLVDVVVTDLRPWSGGHALIDRMRWSGAAVVTLACSGHAIAGMMRRVADVGPALQMRRPLSPRELLAAIAEVRGGEERAS